MVLSCGLRGVLVIAKADLFNFVVEYPSENESEKNKTLESHDTVPFNVEPLLNLNFDNKGLMCMKV